jgi:uncharacterized membrane protein YccC
MNAQDPGRRQPLRAQFGQRCDDLLQLLITLGADLKTLLRPGPRLVDQGEAVASVLLAIGLAQLAGTRSVDWAAFSGFLVIRSQLAASAQRAAFRALGTVVGAIAGCLVAARVAGHPAWASTSLLCVVTIAMYRVLTSRRMYAWLLSGLTFLMVVVGSSMPHALPPVVFARARVAEILIGTAAGLIVSYLSSKLVRRRIPGDRPASPASHPGWHAQAAWHAMKAGATVALLPLFRDWVPAATLTQAGITVLAVMTVPLGSLERESGAVSTRMVHRFIGCSLGALLAMAILLTCRHSLVLMTLGVCMGVAIGRHVENGPSRYGYIGVQFALAFLVVLVPDDYSLATIRPGMERLLGILGGFALLTVTLPLFRAVRLQLSRHIAEREGD